MICPDRHRVLARCDMAKMPDIESLTDEERATLLDSATRATEGAKALRIIDAQAKRIAELESPPSEDEISAAWNESGLGPDSGTQAAFFAGYGMAISRWSEAVAGPEVQEIGNWRISPGDGPRCWTQKYSHGWAAQIDGDLLNVWSGPGDEVAIPLAVIRDLLARR